MGCESMNGCRDVGSSERLCTCVMESLRHVCTLSEISRASCPVAKPFLMPRPVYPSSASGLFVARGCGSSSVFLQVFIHCEREEFRKELDNLMGDEELLAEPDRTNGVDDLRFVFMVSKVLSIQFRHLRSNLSSMCFWGRTVELTATPSQSWWQGGNMQRDIDGCHHLFSTLVGALTCFATCIPKNV